MTVVTRLGRHPAPQPPFGGTRKDGSALRELVTAWRIQTRRPVNPISHRKNPPSWLLRGLARQEVILSFQIF
jgi:hypothetical protein